MADEPPRREVRPSPALLQQAQSLYGPERGDDDTPSLNDFLTLMLPRLIEAVAVTWPSAQAVPSFDGLARETGRARFPIR